MELWNHCENPYPFVPNEVLEEAESVRASLPNRYCDPKIAARLYDEIFDEYRLCDDLGLHIVTNEHHSGINNLWAASPVITGVVANITKKSRILSLGTLITVRPDPVRIAEEYATADIISRGRLDIGFVKSGGTEMPSANVNPVRNEERYWEAIDLITKALTSHDGPFSWEGKHYTHRQVNIWPGPYQRPHPPMWSATGDVRSAAEVGRRSMRHVLVLRGVEGTKRAYQAHRQARRDAGLPPVTTDNFAYAAFVYVGDTEEEGRRVGSKLLWFLNTSLKSAPQHSRFMPGSAPPEAAPQIYRDATRPAATSNGGGGPNLTNAEKGVTVSANQNARRLMSLGVDEAMAMGILFVGNPDSVYRQIMDFHDKVGGFHHLSMIGRSGFMTHRESEKGIRLFAKEILPRLKEIKAVEAV
jgi:alkanesulfonate monooxygenase SsuD/methylene tetrahydromethanopterin reductase-like flavin-dependent oxidoreductase (luciferase family)